MSRLRFRHARLLDPESGLDECGDLLVEGDRIAGVGGDLAAAALDIETIDAERLCLAPGLVDMRVQLREPGAEHMESIETAGRAAAAGGVTTMVALPNTDPPVDDVSVVEFVARRARNSTTETSSTGGSVFGNATIVVTPPAAAARPAVSIDSMCSAPGSRNCTRISTRPGARQIPARSTISASPPVSAPISGPNAAIWSPSTSRSPRWSRPLSGSSRRALR